MPRPYQVTPRTLSFLLAGGIALAAIWMLAPADTQQALTNSAILAAGTTAIALPLGTLLAVQLARFDLFGRRPAAVCVAVLLFLPLYVQLSGWDAAVGKLGWYSLLYGSIAEPFLAGMRGATFVHAMAATPWVALLVGLGLLQVDPAQEEAALLVAPPAVVLWRIALPQTLPFVIAAAIWTVISTTSDMTVTNIFLINPGERTFTEQFYSTFSATADAGEATLAVLPGVACLGLLIVATVWMVEQYGGRHSMVSLSRSPRFYSGPWHWPLTVLLWTAVGILLAVPVASLISKAGFVVVQNGEERVRSWSALKCASEVISAPSRFAAEFGWTLVIAIAAATVATAMSIMLAWFARRGGKRALPAIGAIVLGLAVPGPLVGVALIWLLNHDLPPLVSGRDGSAKSWLLVLYDETPLAPILAQAVRALPLATLLAWHSFRTISNNVLDAAALDGLAPRQVLWQIALPQRRAALAGAWLAAFAVASGDLAWALLVLPPGMDTIQRRVFGLVHSGVEEQVAAISLVNVIVYALAAWLILRLFNWDTSHRGTEAQRGVGKVQRLRPGGAGIIES